MFYKAWIASFVLVVVHACIITAAFSQNSNTRNYLTINAIGDSHYSHLNFTDLKAPYQGIDSWLLLKTSFWLDKNERVGPYVGLLGSHMFFTDASDSIAPFYWQRFIQTHLGLEFYPFYDKYDNGYKPWHGLRLFALAGLRHYFSKASVDNPFTDYGSWDVQIGFDYYYDNLFQKTAWTLMAWTNGSYRMTNFSHEGLREFLWTGNVKLGLKKRFGTSILLPYVVADWSYAQACPCRFWENYIRPGLGLKLFPKAFRYHNQNDPARQALRRLNVYVEVFYNLSWLGEVPENDIQLYDWRIGISYATSGIFRNEQ